MKKKSLAAIFAFCFIKVLALEAFAFDSPNLLQYHSEDSTITLYVNDVSSDEISCRIAGQECRAAITGKVSEAEKYKTLFLVDSSTSMRSYSEKISSFILECIDKKQDNEYYSIAIFDGKSASGITDFTANQYTLEKAVDNIEYNAESSYIFDNINNAVIYLKKDDDKCYERIVVFTDGCENSTVGINVEELEKTIEENLVQIYTVTFVNKKKDNYEELKNVARIARTSNASDIQISEKTDIIKVTKTLFDDAASISSVEITIDNTIADGSSKAIELVSGETEIKAEITMPMLDNIAVSETTVTETEIIAEPTEISETEEIVGSRGNTAVYTVLAALLLIIAAVCIVIVIININKNNKIKEKNETDTYPTNNDDTVILASRGGDTEMFFDNDAANSVIVLRDIMSTDHTFEASLLSDIIIGRSSELSSLVIDYDKSVSKRHCKIFAKGSEVYIEDLGSANKTFVNDVQITSSHVIRNADEIKIGRVKFKVTIR